MAQMNEIQIRQDVMELAGMYLQLAGMYEKESYLKKHHKAYLHVREKADAMCAAGVQRCKEIGSRYLPAVRSTAPSEEQQIEVQDMVVLNLDTFASMQDDMIAMTTVMDYMVKALIEEAYNCERREALKRMAYEASKLSGEVFNRWEKNLMVDTD